MNQPKSLKSVALIATVTAQIIDDAGAVLQSVCGTETAVRIY